MNTTTIALIPKKSEACTLGEYRPISLCNIVYKVITKIIARRMKPILVSCISKNQAAFLKGRSLGENVLLASELIRNYPKSSCPKSSMLKVDIRKAFDTVSWDFVLKVLEAQGFPPLFRTWIQECISSPRFSVSINGELAGFFPGEKGLRQGDSISPYLFIMVMEVLSKLIDRAVESGNMRLHPLCSEPRVTHLLFADDLFVFSDGSRHSLTGIASVMNVFKEFSGLDMNPSKSELFFGGYNETEIAVLCDLAGIRAGVFPTRYLGLPLNPSRITTETLQPFIEKVTSKLQSWTVKYLSFAGKVTMISSVIYGMVNFWSSVFDLPTTFYAQIDSLCAAFLWNNKTTSARCARVAWTDICRPKSEGGLGIRLLEDFQTVFRLKQVWSLFTNSGSLWVAWLHGNVFSRKSYWLTDDAVRFSRSVRSLLQLKPLLVDFMRCELRNGRNCSFWFDIWSDMGSLNAAFGDLDTRQLRIRKNAMVSDAVRNGHWALPPARSQAAEALQIVLTTIPPPDDSLGNDRFLWRQANETFAPNFSSKITWENLRTPSPIKAWHKIIWFKELIPRNAFISWLARLRRLPTRDRLTRWGLNVPPICVLCNAAPETHHHIFFECEYSSAIWVSSASAILPHPPLDIHSAVAWLGLSRGSSSAQALCLLKIIFQAAVYLIWKERNARIFTSTSIPAAQIRSSLDRLVRDRILSLPPSTNLRQPSLLLFYLSCIRPP